MAQTRVSCIMIAVVNNQPVCMSLHQMLKVFIDFRVEVRAEPPLLLTHPIPRRSIADIRFRTGCESEMWMLTMGAAALAVRNMPASWRDQSSRHSSPALSSNLRDIVLHNYQLSRPAIAIRFPIAHSLICR